MLATLFAGQKYDEEKDLIAFLGEVADDDPEPTRFENEVVFTAIVCSTIVPHGSTQPDKVRVELFPFAPDLLTTQRLIPHIHNRDQGQAIEVEGFVSSKAVVVLPSCDQALHVPSVEEAKIQSDGASQGLVTEIKKRPIAMSEETHHGWPSWEDYKLYLSSCVAGLTWKGLGGIIVAGLTWVFGEFNTPLQVLCGLILIRIIVCRGMSIFKPHVQNLRATWNILPPIALVALATMLDKVVTFPGCPIPLARTLVIGSLYVTEISGILSGIKKRGYDVPEAIRMLIGYWKDKSEETDEQGTLSDKR